VTALHPQLREILKRELGDAWHKKVRELKARDVWHKLKKERREPEYSRNVYAQDLGFPNYQRLTRACNAVFRKSPSQLELMVIEEFLNACAEGGYEIAPGVPAASPTSEGAVSDASAGTERAERSGTNGSVGSTNEALSSTTRLENGTPEGVQHVQKSTAGNVA